jgi:N-acetylmuramoyl-L-alanine amidase
MSGYENHYEKEYALDWALRLQKLLFNHGWRVYLTRTNDADLSLAQRVSLAERWQADLFISLHFNSAPSTPEAAGLETYCLTPTGMPSSVTRADDGLGLVFPNNAFDDLNLQYAARLHRALVEATKADDRMIRRARFLGVLRGQNRPAVLLEGGYLSNPQEAQRIADPRYRQKLSQAVAQALRGD